ncbi:sterol carrier protein domain-containing protein [Streptomyces sp. NPDC051642]|uniref:sterol carrier protein domain-containing protein n=1 Tax=Streptomyces sp. NPDC051642 TaxID=3154646 RepID=UPI003439166E
MTEPSDYWNGPLAAGGRPRRSRLRTDPGTADLRLTAAELGAAFLGGTTLASLAAAGLVEELRAGALARVTAAFRADREPFYPGGWAFPAY